jgi:hypothetical protein
MVNQFKFLQSNDATDYVHVGQPDPPFGISRRHWNIIPQDLRGGPELNMLIYIQGWEDARNNITLNPYNDIEMREIWNRGYWRCINRIR